jgi:fatty acid desaturase
MPTSANALATAAAAERRARLAALNFSLAAAHVLANLFQFFVLPLYLLPKSMAWSLALIPLAASNNSFWALIHESIHDLLDSSRRLNDAAGRLLAVFFGSPFRLLRLTHLSHHKFNRSLKERGTEIYDPQATSKIKAQLRHFGQILGGLYLSEVLTPLLFLLPRRLFHDLARRMPDPESRHEQWLARNLTDARAFREIRIDGAATLIVFALSAFCYRGHEWLFAAILLSRAFFISFLDNVYHYGTPLNRASSGYNLRLPKFLSSLILNFNLHGVHHVYPYLPWTRLPEFLVRQGAFYDQGYFTAAARQLRGPVPLPEIGSGRAKTVPSPESTV